MNQSTVVTIRVPKMPRINPADRFPNEASLEREVAKIFENPNEWMNQDHPLLGGRSPQACVNANDDQPVWDLVRQIQYVGQT